MYKRRVKILFMGAVARKQTANLAAHELGAGWLEVATFADIPFIWADLIVTLDESALARLPAPPASTHHKYWAIDHATPADIRQRVLGMIGGLRMLARWMSVPEDKYRLGLL